MPKRKQQLIDIAPAIRRIRDELEVVSLHVLDFGRGDEDDDARRRRPDIQQAVNEGWSRVVGRSGHEASAGDIRALVASLSNVIDVLRALKAQS